MLEQVFVFRGRGFHDAAVGGEVAVEDDEGGGWVERVCEGADYLAGEFEGSEWGGVEELAEGLAGDGQGVEI